MEGIFPDRLLQKCDYFSQIERVITFQPAKSRPRPHFVFVVRKYFSAVKWVGVFRCVSLEI